MAAAMWRLGAFAFSPLSYPKTRNLSSSSTSSPSSIDYNGTTAAIQPRSCYCKSTSHRSRAGEEGFERKVASVNGEEWNKGMKFALSSVPVLCARIIPISSSEFVTLRDTARKPGRNKTWRPPAPVRERKRERVKERKGRDQRRCSRGASNPKPKTDGARPSAAM